MLFLNQLSLNIGIEMKQESFISAITNVEVLSFLFQLL